MTDLKPREEAESFIETQLKEGSKPEDCRAWHYGKCELKVLLDFIYGEKSMNKDYLEELQVFVDNGGRLNHMNAVDLLKEVRALKRSIQIILKNERDQYNEGY